MALYGALEAGGSNFVCAVGTGPADIRDQEEFRTTSPDETLGRAADFFRRQEKLAGLGIGSFGPIDLTEGSPTYGFITTTPKPGWNNVDVVGALRRELHLDRIAFDTDVNAAAMGEHRWGAAQGLDTFVYITIGTGIGGGAMVNGRLLHGLLHPEMGHVRIPHDRQADPFPGCCGFHQDCLEGLASGVAIERRWKAAGEHLGEDHEAWRLEEHYIALGVTSLICTLSPQRVIIGGGVMRKVSLPRLRAEVVRLLNGYIRMPAILDRIDEYVVVPELGEQAGVLGAMALAMDSQS